MNRGDFYASTGVTLRKIAYDAQRRTIAVEVQPEPGVSYTIEFIGTLSGVDPKGEPAEGMADNGEKSKRPGRKYSPEVGKDPFQSARRVSHIHVHREGTLRPRRGPLRQTDRKCPGG